MKRIFITYATWAGSTRSIAEEIGDVIKQNGHTVTLANVNDVSSLSEFDGIVLGTSIHAGQTVRSFRKFLKNYIEQLSSLPVALFVGCANMMEDTAENRSETLGWIQKAISKYQTFQPISIGLFGGGTVTEGPDFENLNFLLKRIILIMDQNLNKEFGSSDFRDTEKIRDWAKDTLAKIIN